jgi:hypothetical protein
MYRSNLILSILLLFSLIASAQEDAEPVSILSEESLETPTKAKAVTFTYMSWMELVDVDNGAIVDNTKHATFFGAGIGYQQEKFNKRLGWVAEGSYIFGQSHIGETSGAISYQKNYVKWNGVSASARFAYRLGAPVTISAGPILVARKVTWPDLPANTDVKSGSEINLGAIAEAKILFNKNWELKQSLGTLAFKAATYWSLGLGYHY